MIRLVSHLNNYLMLPSVLLLPFKLLSFPTFSISILDLEKQIWGVIIQIMSLQLPCSAGLKGKLFGDGSSSRLCLLIAIMHFLKSRAGSTPNAYVAVLGSYQLAFQSPFHASTGGGDSKSTCSGFLCQKMPPCSTSFFLNNLL